MRSIRHGLCALLCALPAAAQRPPHPDHHEFEATLQVPYADPGTVARTFGLSFAFPDAEDLMVASWRVEVSDAKGQTLRAFRGETALVDARGEAAIAFDGRDAQGRFLAPGHYRVRLVAWPMSDRQFRSESLPDRATRVDYHLARAGGEAEVQEFGMEVGHPARPAMPTFRGLAFHRGGPPQGVVSESLPAAGSLPYTIFLGNLHSQTNDSDGGGDVSTCTGAQNPQSGPFGPADAYQYAINGGLDLLMCSEHNHLFDGSTGTNASADPVAAKNRFAAGLSEAANFSAAHPGFLALYGMEWGVITNGGHLNIFNPDGLAEWEYNSSNQLIGDYFTAKGDYASLYTFMKSKGWVGQFNHPATTGQFNIGGTDLAYSADGDAVMSLCEVLNTSAFSHNTTETETSHSSYEAAWNILLERGFHLAPTTDQDNHCANWGLSYHNRTGILIPSGTALTLQSFVDAVRARHVYATMDKTAQIILTANGHIMGDRFSNNGPVTLTVDYTAGSGQAVSQVQIFEGVPGSNGSVAQAASVATVTLTPATGSHFYYAKITQADGDMLWSAPVWVDQGTGSGDTQPPTVSASETGATGSITLAATAADNVGVAQVDFYLDGALAGTDAASPYSLAYDSTKLSNGTHTLVAKASDAAGNVGTSATVSFSVNNSITDTQPPVVSASESGTSGSITLAATATDNVGVAQVDFYLDGALAGTDAASPYSLIYDSTKLANGTHTLVAKASDAAGNVGVSSTVSFSVSNGAGTASYTEVEPNNSRTAADSVGDSVATITGYFPSASDNDDWYAVTLLAGHTLTVDMTGPTASGQDYDLYLYSSGGTRLASSTGSSTTEHVSYKNTNTTTPKTIYIDVNRYNSYSRVTPYSLTLSR
ncbi:MAG TPA: Ig-like domain-containing protein [Holophagaceae bacterium]|nr:Ig-like domain-containing protein [Holophagaceae bacterium]